VVADIDPEGLARSFKCIALNTSLCVLGNLSSCLVIIDYVSFVLAI